MRIGSAAESHMVERDVISSTSTCLSGHRPKRSTFTYQVAGTKLCFFEEDSRNLQLGRAATSYSAARAAVKASPTKCYDDGPCLIDARAAYQRRIA